MTVKGCFLFVGSKGWDSEVFDSQKELPGLSNYSWPGQCCQRNRGLHATRPEPAPREGHPCQHSTQQKQWQLWRPVLNLISYISMFQLFFGNLSFLVVQIWAIRTSDRPFRASPHPPSGGLSCRLPPGPAWSVLGDFIRHVSSWWTSYCCQLRYASCCAQNVHFSIRIKGHILNPNWAQVQYTKATINNQNYSSNCSLRLMKTWLVETLRCL